EVIVDDAEAGGARPQPGGRRLQLDLGEELVLRDRARRGQDDVPGPGHGRGEPPVVGRAPGRGLGEDDVEPYRRRMAAAHDVEEPSVERARPGPGQVQLVER